MLKKVDICCFVYGNNFLLSLDKIALPSFVKSLNKTNYNFEYNYVFITLKKFKNKLHRIVSKHVHEKKFNIHLIDDTNSMQKPLEITVWNTQMRASACDYFLILIPDNYYFLEYANNILKKIKNNDIVIGLPPYICKDTIELESINLHSFGYKDTYDILTDHAHPFYFGLIGNSQRNIKGYYQSSEQELTIDIFNKEIIIDINCAHPIAFSSKNFSFDHLNFKTRLKKNIFKTSYLDSIFHLSVDSYHNKLRLINKNSAKYFLDNLLTLCENFSDHPWEAFRTLSFWYRIKKNYNQRVISEKIDLYYILKDKKFIQHVKNNCLKIESIYDLYLRYEEYNNSLLIMPFNSPIILNKIPVYNPNIIKLFIYIIYKIKSKINTLAKFLFKPNLRISKSKLKNIYFGIKSQNLFKSYDQ